MSDKITISFLASHGGSAAKQIIEAVEQGVIHAGIGIVITNNHDSAIYQWCQTSKIPVQYISGKTHSSPEMEDQAIMEALKKTETGLVVLSGYMKKIGSQTLSAFSGKIMNIHPSLLPKHGGQGMYGDRVHKAVLEAGEDFSGASVQIINEEYDEGPVLAQKQVPVLQSDSVETLKARVQGVEGDLYIEAIRDLLNNSEKKVE